MKPPGRFLLFVIVKEYLKHFSNKNYFFTSVSRTVGPTIFALSSGFGKCGVAVIRVSGPGVTTALKEIAGFKDLPDSRKVELRKIRNPITKEVLDHGLVFWFPGPKSFTGEDCCEFQVHGGPAVVSSVLGALGKLKNFRTAEPGEFTKRAFYSGKVDLTQVEGLAALVDSETEMQRRQALRQADGDLFKIYSQWSQTLLKYVANVEAFIDFDEDQDLGSDVLETTNNEVKKLKNTIKSHLTEGRRGERIREGVRMTILGAPNAGKSSLINLLCKRPVAIVSDMPGTTRDVLDACLDIGGYPVNLSDTAGLRGDPADPVEVEGVRRAKSRASHSDMVLFLIDAGRLKSWIEKRSEKLVTLQSFARFFKEHIDHLQMMDEVLRCDNLKPLIFPEEYPTKETEDQSVCGLIILNKLDLFVTKDLDLKTLWLQSGGTTCGISCKTEQGVDVLLENVVVHLQSLCGSSGKCNPVYSRTRQRLCLEECIQALEQYLQLTEAGQSHLIDLAANQLRQALDSLGKITGRVSTEEVLDVIFKDFCIGK